MNWKEKLTHEICRSWRHAVESIFNCGALLIRAKKKFPGTFEKWVESELPFGTRTAQRLMAIAQDERLRNPTHASHWPASWMTMYAITRLNDAQFEEAVATGVINPDMERRDLDKYLKPEPPPLEVLNFEGEREARRPPQTARVVYTTEPRVMKRIQVRVPVYEEQPETPELPQNRHGADVYEQQRREEHQAQKAAAEALVTRLVRKHGRDAMRAVGAIADHWGTSPIVDTLDAAAKYGEAAIRDAIRACDENQKVATMLRYQVDDDEDAA